MGSRVVLTFLSFLIMFSLKIDASDFDVKKYGAKCDGKTDDSAAFNQAWKEACAATTPSKVVVSAGTYLASSLTFTGPCKAPITFQIAGTIKAPPEAGKLKSQECWVLFQIVDQLTVEGGGSFDGQGQQSWKCGRQCSFNRPANVRFFRVTNSVVRGIKSLNSKMFHFMVLACQHVQFQSLTITAPGDSPNTDGLHIAKSKFINVTNSHIATGDDCISLGDGSEQIHAEKITCGPGHGLSIGSLGRYHNEEPIKGISFKNCSISGTLFGVRIKTMQNSPTSVASDIHYEDIVMKDVIITPILIDQEYCPTGGCKGKPPSKVKLSNISFKKIRGTSLDPVAIKLVCSQATGCMNVQLSEISLTGSKGPVTSECNSHVKPVISGKNSPAPCSKRIS